MHAEKLSNHVLQSVVDLLWNQLNSMLSLLTNNTSGDDADPAVPSNYESVNRAVSDEALVQCKLSVCTLLHCLM